LIEVFGGTPCHSADGTIYFGTVIGSYQGGEIIAVNADGTEKWRKGICDMRIEFAPLIVEDGTVYIGSSSDDDGDGYGHLHAFGSVENNNPPNDPTIDGPLEGNAGWTYWYRFRASDPDNHPITYLIDWGDRDSEWTIYHESNRTIKVDHIWDEPGNYTISCKVQDSVGDESDWAYLDVEMIKQPPEPEQIRYFGFIRDLAITNTTVSFQVIFAFNSDFPRLLPVINEDVVYPNDYEGHLGDNFVWATFYY